ncbi:MAG: hypothetical protein HC930_15930 [Hydrococcus sp. SU_1_0]|nr:hypothetical protein [Hydrococcus sp. SU_1_0]
MIDRKQFIGWMFAGLVTSGVVASCSAPPDKASQNSEAQAKEPEEVKLTLAPKPVLSLMVWKLMWLPWR